MPLKNNPAADLDTPRLIKHLGGRQGIVKKLTDYGWPISLRTVDGWKKRGISLQCFLALREIQKRAGKPLHPSRFKRAEA